MNEISEDEAYDGWALLVDIGASLGLFMGASIVTLIELIYIGIIKFFCHTNRPSPTNMHRTN